MYRGLKLFLAAFACTLLIGCKDLSESALSVLNYSAITAKERALAWELERPWVIAKKESDAAAAEKYASKHAENLNAQAKGLADLMASVKADSKLLDATRVKLAEQAQVAKATAENFRGASLDLNVKTGAPKTWDEISKTHQGGLDALAEGLLKLSAEAPPKSAKAKEKPVKPVNTP